MSVLLLAAAAVAAEPAAAVEGIGFASVDAAFRALKAEPAAKLEVRGDWSVFVVTRPGGATERWYFTRPGHPAHPSVVKRWQAPGAAHDDRGEASLCQASPRGCQLLQAP